NRSAERPYVVIFLTDGRPTIGVTSEEQIVANVRQAAAGTRVFCFGIGTDVNTHLLDKITEETKAYSQYVLPEEDIEVKVSAFFTKIKEPVLANVKIHFPASLRVTKLYPAPLPDLFRGEQLVLAGRYAPNARAIERTQKGDERKLIIEGTVNGEKKTFTYDVNFPDETREHDFIPRLWATRRVGYLLDEIRLRGENAELKDEVTELARRYGIVTPYTAYLIVEDEARRGVAANQRSLRELERDDAAVRQSAWMFENFRKEKSGNLAVAGAQFSDSFKNADRVGELSKLSADSAVRNYSGVAATAPSGNLYVGGTFTATPASPALTPAIRAKADATQRLANLTQQNQFIAGKNFFQNGAQWVDAEAQKLTNSKPVRVQFNSKEYFALQAKHPEAAPWLALGSQVQFTLKGALYEIHE
ncbi:MAG: VWA domain-containing protein, partial [Verrucomicrobia bacterium]|nr:VWA domain-containing protein [Verrucomicrobiota bacterium]